MIRPRRVSAWWRLPPSALPSREDERHATWLELFFDLVFVLALLTVQNRLNNDPSPDGARLLGTLGLFAVVWWAWVGQAFYDTRFDPDDGPHRLAVLVGMTGAGAMALGAENAPDTLLLPIGYLVVRASLLALYLRVRGSHPTAGRVTTVYLIGFGAGWLLWLGSLAAPAGVRPAMWLAGLVIEYMTPWVGRPRLVQLPVHPAHLPERIGQFTIILLGTTLTDLLDAVPARPSAVVVAATATAFVVPASVWWVYTTFVTTGLAIPRLSAGLGYTYVHGLLGADLLLLGWVLGQVVRQVHTGSPELPGSLRFLVVLSIGGWMLGGMALQWVSLGFLAGRRMAIAAAGIGLVVIIGVEAPSPITTLLLLATVLVGYTVVISRHIVRIGGEQVGP